jgi:hypothetical protein
MPNQWADPNEVITIDGSVAGEVTVADNQTALSFAAVTVESTGLLIIEDSAKWILSG